MATKEVGDAVQDAEAVRREWLERLDALIADVRAWSEASGWRSRRIQKTVEERELGRYQVPVLLMEKDAVEVVLNPVARFVPGADGAADLYLSPAYDDIASLYHEGGRWCVHDAERPALGGDQGGDAAPRPCDEPTIRAILGRMARDA